MLIEGKNMNWQHFQTYNEAPTRAFECMGNQLFELWCRKTYPDSLKTVTIVNGSGGDGGVESFAIMQNGTIIGMQTKWFLNSISTNQFGQISNSIETALRVRPLIKQYIVCIPRDLSSDRIGKGKKVIEDTELSRWEQLKDKLEGDYPGLKIELWNETQLLTKLQDSDAAGIYRYWFEKSEISKELIVYSYEKQKSGWLSQKYTPCLHIQGRMQKSILKFIGTLSDRQSSINTLNAMSQQCSKFLKACDDYLQFVQDNSSQEQLIHEIQKTQEQVIKLLDEIKLALEAVSNDQQVASSINENNWYIDFVMLLELLKQNEQFRVNYFHISEIKKTVEALQANEIHNIISNIRFQLNNKKYLILGNPGSGKTHGIANLVELLLNGKSHIPILIRAKDINPNNNWIDIIKKSLGLASVWNETELWQALEALSYRVEINNIFTTSTVATKIIPKILICIEGVDESKPYDLWYDRLREIEAICSKYSRIRFCITSRPYVFRKLAYDDSLLSNTLRLPSDGDVPVNVLFQEYIEFFHINIEGCFWIKWSLKTPLALRIFCENYKYRSISGIDKSSITITNLLSHKFNIIEKEFNSKYETGYGDKELIVQNSLLVIARKFLLNTTVYRNDLIDSLKGVPGLITIAHDYRRELIDFVEDYGILQSYTVNPDTIFEPPKTYYSIGVQPFFDYILALLITNQIKDPSEIIIPDTLASHEGALQMASILLLEDYNYLITENKSFSDSLSNNELFDLVCFSLSNVSPDPASKYKPLVKRMMNFNSDCLKNVVNKIILPVSRIENHPLGAQMLHEYLMGYETSGKRDIIWSAPSYLWCQGDAPWKCYTKIDLADKRYELCFEDKYNGIPLVYAWMLTTVNNIERVGYRRELMKWASIQPFGFYKLFGLTYNTNDPQMKEDLFAIAMGTVFMLEEGHPCIKLFSDWMIENVFASDKISMYYNCAIRYYSRAIIERSYAFGYVRVEDVDKSRPPYHTSRTIPLNHEATSGTRMGGFGPIDYDLSRYVLCDPMDNMFFSRRGSEKTNEEIDYTWYFSENEIEEILTNKEISLKEKCSAKLKEIQLAHKQKKRFWDCLEDLIDDDTDTIISNSKSPIYIYNKEADSFLLEHAHILEMELLESNQFVLSAAYAYILLQGWNEEEFHGHPNGDKPGEVIGVDVAILRQYYAATHGSKSSVMTFCEKYIWCARNEILGYLSDRLLFRNFDKAPSLLNDYGLLDDFPNPAQELYQENPDKIMGKTSWFIPEELSPLINENMGEDAIRDWIINAPTPNFEKWIDIQDFNHEIAQERKKTWISLYSYNSVSNTLGGESILWISSAIISREHFKYLINDIIKRKDFIVHELSNPEDLYSSTETQCYITPKEICWMSWKNECYNKISNISIDIDAGDFANYTIEKAVEECTANYPEFGDVYYKLPSRIIRKMLGICDGDGYKYYNGEKQLEAICFGAGEKWHDSQSYLCIDREKLLLQLDHFNFKIFWTVRLLRQATSKSLEKYPKLHSQNDKCWLVWFEDGELRTQLYLDQID
jgi:hypothetical protein